MNDWKQHPDDPKIWVTPGGQVYRRVNEHHPERRQWALRKFDVDKDGYHRCRIAGKSEYVARLVYRLFVGGLVEGLVICHVDGDRTNNVPANLIQATQAVNIRHKKDHGTHQSGGNHPCAKHTQVDIGYVRAELKNARRTSTGRLARGEAIRIAEDTEVSIHVVHDLSAQSKDAWACL
jgi:hypothetical protein